MPIYYEAVDEEPTYELAESVIKATIYVLKLDTDDLITYPYLGYRHLIQYSLEDNIGALLLIVKHFPNVLTRSDKYVYVKDSSKHLLITNDLLVMDYYLLLLNEYEERIKKYQLYLKKQQDRQHFKLLFVIALPFTLLTLMILVGD